MVFICLLPGRHQVAQKQMSVNLPFGASSLNDTDLAVRRSVTDDGGNACAKRYGDRSSSSRASNSVIGVCDNIKGSVI